MPKLYFLHGFLGDVQDWNEVIKRLPEYECHALKYPFKLPKDGILIGYSMGGRIALGSNLPKIVISGHPGLQTEEQKEAQVEKENYWIEKLKSVPLKEFLQEWYAQPLFTSLRTNPLFPKLLERRLKQDPLKLIDQIQRHSLAQQPFMPQNAYFIHGAYDQAYKELYKKLNIPSYEIPKAGHACHIENPAEVARQIKILINKIN